MAKTTNMGKRRAAAAVDSSPFYQEKKREIYAAAANVFRQRGYEATTLAQVAQELDIDRATLYYYASSKQELLYGIVHDAAEKNVEIVEEIIARDCSATEKLYCTLQALMKVYSATDPFTLVFLQHFTQTTAGGNPEWNIESQNWARRFYNAIRSILEQGVAEGEFVLSAPVGIVTMGVIGMINWSQVTGRIPRQGKGGVDLTPEEVGTAFADILLAGFGRSGGDRGPETS